MPRRAGLYLDAAINLRPRQVLNRPRRLIPLRLLARDRSAPNGWEGVAGGLGVDPAPQSGPQPPPHETGRFAAVGRNRAFPSDEFWSTGGDGLLFAFHLHAFEPLAAYSAGARTAAGDAFWADVIEDWLRACGEPARPAWHPFPMSGRDHRLVRSAVGGRLARRAHASGCSGAWRGRRARCPRSIEHDIGGNHVLRNGTALAVAGVCLADRRLEARALRLLERELRQQILDDGGHEERSPAYHRAVLADLEDVRRLLAQAGREPATWLDSTIAGMRAWLASLAGPGDDLPLLNDAWEGPALVQASREPLVDLEASGYIRLRGDRLDAVLDVGPVAPRHLPPHAHADVLSFVLWADDARLVVDSGSLAYEGADRDAFRATRAHNTVEVDGRDQCEFWGPFRAAFMPRVTRLRADEQGDVVVIAAEHDGYARLADPVIHRRTFVWVPAGGLVVIDRLICEQEHEAASYVHLAPGVDWDGVAAGPLEIRSLGAGSAPVSEAGRYAPFIGTAIPATTIARRSRLGPDELGGWSLLRPGFSATLRGDRVALEGPGMAPAEVRVA